MTCGAPRALPPLSVYVHLPWCVRKCPYCDFNSHEARSRPPWTEYVDALLADLDDEAGLVQGREVGSVFFGGGTPSLCPPAEIGRFLEGLAGRVRMAADVEVTLEANPGTIERGRFADFALAGVNRVSLGVQTFRPESLRAIGRIHDDRQAETALSEIATAGIVNFNVDLMYGLPGQDLAAAREDVHRAIDAGATHLSHYQLTLEPGTPFHSRPPSLPEEDVAWAMQETGFELLAGAGFEQYEVSAWAAPGRRCRHNLNYWEFGDYLGLGAGAHGKVTCPDGRAVRRRKRRRPASYLGPEGRLEAEEWPGPDDLAFEFMLNALRLSEGFSWRAFEERTGVSRDRLGPPVARAEAAGLLERIRGGARPTATGRRFLNDLQALFLPEAPPA